MEYWPSIFNINNLPPFQIYFFVQVDELFIFNFVYYFFLLIFMFHGINRNICKNGNKYPNILHECVINNFYDFEGGKTCSSQRVLHTRR